MKQNTSPAPALPVTFNGYARAAIVAKVFGPGYSRAARIKVTSQRSSRFYSYPHDLSGDACFDACVAEYLAEIRGEDLKQYGEKATGWGELANWAGGTLPTGERVYVQIAQPI